MLQAYALVWKSHSGLAATLNRGVNLIQRNVRGKFARRFATQQLHTRRINEACLKLQANYRGVVGRVNAGTRRVAYLAQLEQERLEKLRQEQREDEAAITIQCLARQCSSKSCRFRLEVEREQRRKDVKMAVKQAIIAR
jgi:hypothetical protein